MANQQNLTKEDTEIVEASTLVEGDRYPVANDVATVTQVSRGRKSVQVTMRPDKGGSVTKHLPFSTKVRIASRY